jgi:predicted nucleic acid-binding protein
MKLVDTNILIRLISKDDPKTAKRCRNLLLYSDEDIFITDVAIAETVWVLDNRYGLTRDEITRKLIPLLTSPRIEFADRELLQQTLVLFGEHGTDFIDAYHTALGRRTGYDAIYSYDRDFERLKFPRLEP